ncbi:MAG: c-type cytochrome domain-containing protein [Saprospiraceae bacterium]
MKFQTGLQRIFNFLSICCIILITCSILYFSSCVHDPILNPDNSDPVDTTFHPDPVDTTVHPNPLDTALYSGCDSNVIYFNRDILPIFTNSCAITGCHDSRSATEGYIFTDYKNIIKKGIVSGKPKNSDVYEVISTGNSRDFMPPAPYPRLSAKQVNTIFNWISNGLKQDTCVASNVCDTISVGFSKDILPLFAARCTSCHGPLLSYDGVRLDTYAQIKNAIGTGRLLGSVRWEQGYIQMPQDQPKLLGCEIKKIEIWIGKGALNN